MQLFLKHAKHISAKDHCTCYFLCLESSPTDIYHDCCLMSLKSVLNCYFVTEPSLNTPYKMSTFPHCPSLSPICCLIFNRALPPDIILNLFVVCLPWKTTGRYLKPKQGLCFGHYVQYVQN